MAATDWSDAPYPSGVNGDRQSWTRRYVDASGRPMSGKVVLTGKVWIEVGTDVISPSSVPVHLNAAGVASADLPPGEYEVSERLVGPEGQLLNREWQLTLPQP